MNGSQEQREPTQQTHQIGQSHLTRTWADRQMILFIMMVYLHVEDAEGIAATAFSSVAKRKL